MKRCALICLCVVSALALGAGCVSVGGQSAAPRYYVLSSALQEAQETALGPVDAAAGPVIGLRPVEIPKYLDRPQIVTRSAESEVRAGEFDRWAEPLDAAIQRILAENLAAFVPTDRVMIFPWRSTLEVDIQVELRVLEFSPGPEGNVVLVARWAILDGAGRPRTPATLSRFEEPIGGSLQPASYDGVVDAMSAALEKLSREIAEAIRTTLGREDG